MNKRKGENLDSTRQELVSQLSDKLAKVEIYGGFLADPFIFDSLETLWDKYEKKLNNTVSISTKYIGPTPAMTFLAEAVVLKVRGLPEYENTLEPLPLSALGTFHDPLVAASNILAEFEQLPNSYKLILQLPNELGHEIRALLNTDRFKVSDQISIVRGGDEHRSKFPDISARYYRGMVEVGEFTKLPHVGVRTFASTVMHLFIEVDVSGFIGSWIKTRTISDAEMVVKAFLGIGYSLGLFTRQRSSLDDNNQSFFRTYRVDNDVIVPIKAWGVEEDVSVGINRMGLNFSGPIPTQHDMSRCKTLLKSLQNLLSLPDSSDKQRLTLGGQWLFDSLASKNEVLAYVQATTCLEILIGEQRETDTHLSISALLRNRCSYLIAKNMEERNEISKDFSKIYDTRSKIVHRGHNYLSGEQKMDLAKLRNFCSRVIQEEMHLLLGSSESSSKLI